MSKSSSSERTDREAPCAVLSLGSNMGPREENILGAVHELRSKHGIRINALSSLYESLPQGGNFSRTFVNAVVTVACSLSPHGLLVLCNGIELMFGRRRGGTTGDRTLDIDIVLFNDTQLDDRDLVIPHPRFRERGFVLEPLAEITPSLRVPPDMLSIGEILENSDLNGWSRRISSRSAAL